MVNRRASDAAPPPAAIAPVVKRKRRASCLGEQERRERKRAIDREAQRSLREKTKTHIAELERTIQILRDQDRNGATASLLSEIDGLRAENERLRDVIDSVKSVVGSEIFPRTSVAAGSGGGSNANAARSDGGSPGVNGEAGGQPLHTPRPRTNSMATDNKPALPSPSSIVSDTMPSHFDHMNFGHNIPTTSGSVDLDGMTVMSGMEPTHSTSELGLSLDLPPVFEMAEGDLNEQMREGVDVSDEAPDSPTTAAFAPFMEEIFGTQWKCASPVVLHIGEPAQATPTTANALCPIWKKSNELFGKVFSYRPESRPQDPERSRRVSVLPPPKNGETGYSVQKLQTIKILS